MGDQDQATVERAREGLYVIYQEQDGVALLRSGVGHIVEAVQQGRLLATWKSHREHVASLRERHGSNVCPKCGSELVERVAKTGGNAGKSFLGCSSFPKCRYMR